MFRLSTTGGCIPSITYGLCFFRERVGLMRLRASFAVNLVLILLFTAFGFAVMGYHPGTEDDALYLSAIKADLNPALYPHDAKFFRIQLEATYFDRVVAWSAQATGSSVATTVLVWQFGALALTLFACLSIAGKLFAEQRAQWGGVALVAALFAMPVAGTALFLADPHLHPRNVATALILLGVSRILSEKRWQAAALLLVSVLIHPIMAAMGISFCFFLSVALSDPTYEWLRTLIETRPTASVAAFVPLGWIFEPATPIWMKAVQSRSYCYLYQWTWYEWLGAVAPIFLFWLLWQIARKQKEDLLARFALAVFAYSVFQQALAMVMLGVPQLIRLTPLQPMRYLQLEYYFLMLIAGCLLGKYVLRAKVWRWALFLLAVNGGMLTAQRSQFSGTEQLEMPGRSSANPWLQAFAWIRANTPTDAYFAMDPRYLAAEGEDYHGFRALAERSQLADAIKDTAVVMQVPELGPSWDRQLAAQEGWKNFQIADFERLKTEFGVNWVLVSNPPPAGLDCQWHNDELAVCKIP
jgi:hypothetical protein